jgi:hypothetical protein
MFLPLLGVMAMESGEVSPFLDVPGRANGATFAYLVHLTSFFIAYRWFRGRRRPPSANSFAAHPAGQTKVDSYTVICLSTFVVLAGLMLFVFRGIDVLLLNIDKADFRISLGPLGGLMTLTTKWLMPAMFAGLVCSCQDYGWTGLRLAAVGACTACLFLVAASWGYKTTFLVMMLPTALLVTRSLNILVLIGMSAFVGLNVILFSLFFDQHQSLETAFDALAFRLTVLQGDLAWYTWDSAIEGVRLPDYWRTFLPIFGDSGLRAIAGVDPRSNYAEWASYYFGPAMTLFGGYPVEGLMSGVNNQATLFGEVLVVGGLMFFPAFSAFSGVVVAYVGLSIDRTYMNRQYAASSTIATFFSFTILSWLIGNGFASLFYLINVVGAFATYFLLTALLPRVIMVSKP